MGEKIMFGVAAVLTVLAVWSVSMRPSRTDNPRPPKDYIDWTDASLAGYALYKSKGCKNCHRVLRMGEIGVAPVLDGEGTRRDREWLQKYFDNPLSLVPGSAHDGSLGPDFRRLDSAERDVLVEFMVGLKSNPGSSNYPKPPVKKPRDK